jgi:hypothetical protein
MSPKNVYEAYLYKYKKCILAFSYIPGINIDFIVNDIAKTFNMKIVKLSINNNNLDYDKLNKDVENIINENNKFIESIHPNVDTNNPYYGQGILIYGLSFPQTKITFKIDRQFHFSLSQVLYLKLNPNSTIEEYNRLIADITTNNVNRYLNIKSEITMDINNDVYNRIIDYFESRVYSKEDYLLYSTKNTSTDKGSTLKAKLPEEKTISTTDNVIEPEQDNVFDEDDINYTRNNNIDNSTENSTENGTENGTEGLDIDLSKLHLSESFTDSVSIDLSQL